MKEINALGKICPIPVIETKKAMRKNQEEKEFHILVDNEVATQNLTKMATHLHMKSSVEKLADKKYKVTIMRDENAKDESEFDEASLMDNSSYVVVVKSDTIADGDPEFSKSLLEGFLYALTEQDKLPKAVIFYNRGVFNTTKNEKVIEDMKGIEEKGVEILSCGLCLDNYKLKEDLKVGTITNMYRIVELMRENHVITPC